jgi:DNA (cytosine-5)-methyltransferase 1
MKCVDLFSGCGGFSKGFEKSGFEVVAAYDNWDEAIEVYKNNFKHPIFKEDLRESDLLVEKISKYNPEIIIGGPPCQDYSSAGKRDVNGGRADLTYHFCDIVCGVKPKWFVMENVEQIKKSLILNEVILQFTSAGYGLSSEILDASYCGVPQSRTRFFLIGCLGIQHNQINHILEKNLSAKPMTVRDYCGASLGIEYYYRHPRNYNRRAFYSIDEPSPTVRGVNRPIPKGYKLNSCDPSGLDISSLRPLSTIERSYIQTFPKNYKFSGSKTALEQMIGNAVPVNLASYVGKSIKEYISTGGPKKTLFSFAGVDEPDNLFKLPQRPLKNV